MQVQRDGDTFGLAWDEHSVAMGMERLTETRDGLRAEVVVESSMAGRVLGPVHLNILSAQSQTGFANSCHKRVNGLSAEVWHALVVQACATVAKQYREPTPVVDLSQVEATGPIQYLIPGLVPRSETTVLYGDGESAKSMLAVRIAFSVRTGHELPWGTRAEPCEVLYLDWETNADTVASRLRGVALGELCAVPSIHYRQCFRALSDELPHIREEISKKRIGLVIVDSIGFAATGALTEDETARSAMNALRNLSPATRLVVAHVSKQSADAPGPVKPFGSAFFWNGMRSGIEVRRAEENPSDNMIDLGVYHRKSNDGRHVKPFGLSVVFDTRSEGILFSKSDIGDVPDLAARTPLSQRIRGMLRGSSKTVRELSDELDVNEAVVKTTLNRMKGNGVIQLTPGGGRGRLAEWGLEA